MYVPSTQAAPFESSARVTGDQAGDDEGGDDEPPPPRKPAEEEYREEGTAVEDDFLGVHIYKFKLKDGGGRCQYRTRIGLPTSRPPTAMSSVPSTPEQDPKASTSGGKTQRRRGQEAAAPPQKRASSPKISKRR
jgi:hypothetical protein